MSAVARKAAMLAAFTCFVDPLTYGVWDGDPFVWTPGEAWVFLTGLWTWRRENSVEIARSGRAMSETAFKARYSWIPPLPLEAFNARFRGLLH